MDPRGKIVVVTGATSGLGQAFAVDIAARGARVILVGRDAARSQETLDTIQKAGGTAEVVLGDVSTRAGVQAVAAAIRERVDRVDVLMNNAGAAFNAESRTVDGIETTLALNTVGPYLLERALHPLLVAARGRIVNVATGFLDSYPVVVDELAAPKKYSRLTQYARCKQALVMVTVEQAERFAPEGVTVVSVNPGIVMGTRFGGGQPWIAQVIGGPIMRMMGLACDLPEAMRRFSMAAFGDVPSGSYLSKGVVAPLPKQVRDVDVRRRVVAVVEQLAG
jgi:NAD(P)-dependent dehydrogenase (short-subunit alcohol dehydrogenase family)